MMKRKQCRQAEGVVFGAMERSQLQFVSPEALLVPARDLRARCNEIHVWSFLLEGSEEARIRCEELLPESERARGRRFYHEHHRHAFVFAHGLMRHILGAYCRCDPAALEFVAGEFGKPMLRGEGIDPPNAVSFNLSHSHGRALLAVSAQREVGVDIEQVSERTNVLGIASSYFCGPELEAIQRASAEQRADTFFRYWSAKEAVLKAQGVGLNVALDSFQILFDEGWATATVESHTPQMAADWRVRSLPCDGGWFAAVVAGGDAWSVKLSSP